MPWKNLTDETERRRFIVAIERGGSFASTCRAHGISRKTGYKWWQRYQADPKHGLESRSRRPQRRQRWRPYWRKRLLELRARRPTWGARKIHDQLHRTWPRAKMPSARTLQRWLAQAGVTKKRRQRAKPGPVQPRPVRLEAVKPNDVWTIDFKGPIPLSTGGESEPLTVFDLASRYALLAEVLKAKDYACTNEAMDELFWENGEPLAIRIDNGPPFGGEGALGLTRLTAEWARRGIQIQFGRPACPQDNSEHERWHRTLEEDFLAFPSRRNESVQARLNRILRIYNEERSHESLGGRRPVEVYRRNLRRFRHIPPRCYPKGWAQKRPNAKGYMGWAHQTRLIGAAFAKQLLGLRPIQPGHWEVYLDHLLIGVLVASDRAGLRPAQLCSLKPSPFHA